MLKAPLIVDPLGLLDCCPTTDGAAAAIITRAPMAGKFKSDPVLLKGIGLAVSGGDRNFFEPDLSFVGFESTVSAAQSAYTMAGITNPRKEINFAEVHDCFTITEILNYEGFGNLQERGRGSIHHRRGLETGRRFASESKRRAQDERAPHRRNGRAADLRLTTQLRGKAGSRQVRNPRMGLAHNLGGPGTVASVCILGI